MPKHLAPAELASVPVSASAAKLGQEAEAGGAPSHRGDVTVHGHWVIEVKDKDGKLADRREFDNSYIGGYFMGLTLSGFQANIDPVILINSKTNGAGSWCSGESAGTNTCILLNNLTTGHGSVDSAIGFCAPAGSCYTGLTYTLTPDGVGGYSSYVLNANIVVVGSGTFDTVATSFGECYNNYFNAPVTLSSATCYTNAVSYDTTSQPNDNYDNNDVTSTTLSTMSVTAGQTVTFTVTISFS